MIIRGSGGSTPWADTGLGYLQVVDTGGYVPISQLTTTANKSRIEWRQERKIGGQDVSALQVVGCNYTASNTEDGPGNTIFVEADVEIPSAPRPGPVKYRWSGSFIGAIPDGTAWFPADLLVAKAFGWDVIPKYTRYFLNGSASVAVVGQKIPYSNGYTFASGEGAVSSARSVAQGGSGAAPSIPPGGAVFTGIGPLMCSLGTFVAPEVSVGVFGSSVPHHNADTFASGLDGASGGISVRGLYSVNGRTVPWHNMAVPGSELILTAANFTKRAAAVPYLTHKFGDGGITNSWATTPGTPSLATMQAAVSTLCGILGSNTAMLTTIPRTTGNMTDPSLQSPLNANYAAGGLRDQLNAALAGLTGVARIIDIDGAVRDAVITDAFKAGYSDFGNHLVGNTALNAAAAVIAAQLATYVGGHP